MTAIQINTSKGPKTPEAALALIKDGAGDQGTLLGIFNQLRDKAPATAVQAAEYVIQNPDRFPDKVKKVVSEIIARAPNRLKAIRITSVVQLHDFLKKVESGEMLRIVFRQQGWQGIENLWRLQDILKPHGSDSMLFWAIHSSRQWGTNETRSLRFVVGVIDPTRLTTALYGFVESIEVLRNP